MIRRFIKHLWSEEFDADMERIDRAEDEARLAQMRRLQAHQDALSATRQGLIDVRDLLAEDEQPMPVGGVLQ